MILLYLVFIFLAIVQGIAEFLPISSSGHLILLQNVDFFNNILMNAFDKFQGDSNLFINVILHVASLIAVIIFFRKDIASLFKGSIKGLKDRNYKCTELKIVFYIFLATIPAGIIGITAKSFFENIGTIPIVSCLLIINGIILICTKKIPLKSRKLEEVGIFRSIMIGFFQAIAILPGISRSGMTIAGGMLFGIKPELAARFSFLMAIPVIASAGLIEGIKAFKQGLPQEILAPLFIAMLVCIIVAMLSLKFLFYLVKKIRLDIFGYYTIIVGISGLLFVFLI